MVYIINLPPKFILDHNFSPLKNSSVISFIKRIKMPVNINNLSELLVLANISPENEVNILVIISHVSSIDGIRNIIHAKFTRRNVMIILIIAINLFLWVSF